MPLMFAKYITRDWVKSHPNYLFVFGDNMERKGLGGQAKEMRGEPNTIGIPTKWSPTMKEDAFFKDLDWNNTYVRSAILDSFSYIDCYWLKPGKIVVFPLAGIGTGKALLEDKAPLIFNIIVEIMKQFIKTYGELQ